MENMDMDFYHSCMEAALIAIWEMELPSGKVRFSEMKTKMLGYSKNMFNHYTDFTKLIHPKDYERAMNAMKSHMKNLTDNYSTEYRIRCHDDTYIWLRDIGKIIKKNEHSLILRGVVLNINNEKLQQEETLALISEAKKTAEENELKYKMLIEHSPFGIGASVNNIPVYANRAMYDIHGFDKMEDFLSIPKRTFLHPEDKEKINKFMEMIQSGKRKLPATIEYRIINKRNEHKYLRAIISELELSSYSYRQSIIFDITKEIENNQKAKEDSFSGIYLKAKEREIVNFRKCISDIIVKYGLMNEDLRVIDKALNDFTITEKEWDFAKSQFDFLHENFFKNLIQLFPKLNQNDLRHCALIKMQKTNAEIAKMFNIHISSLQRYRQRLKTKLNLDHSTDIIKYINSL